MKRFYKINKEIFDFFNCETIKKHDFDEGYLEKNNLKDFNDQLVNKNIKEFENKLKETSEIIKIFNKIEQKTGIPYFSMKSFLSYPFYDYDIDFIISANGYKSYIKELKKIGFYWRKDVSNIREPLKRLFEHKDFLITPHIHSQVSWNGIIAADKEQVLLSSKKIIIKDQFTKIPSDTDELLIAIGHFIFENYYFKQGELIYFKHLLEQDINYDIIEKTSIDYGYRKGVNLFFSYLHALSNCYNLNLKINEKYVYHVEINSNKPFPYYIPYQKLIPVYAENFINGIRRRRFFNLFRKLFTYTLVGYLWKYWLPIRRQKKFLLQFQG